MRIATVLDVQAKGRPGLLTSLFPGDAGVESPRLSNYMAQGAGTQSMLQLPLV